MSYLQLQGKPEDKPTMDVKYNRAGKALTAQIKIPKKLKTTSL